MPIQISFLSHTMPRNDYRLTKINHASLSKSVSFESLLNEHGIKTLETKVLSSKSHSTIAVETLLSLSENQAHLLNQELTKLCNASETDFILRTNEQAVIKPALVCFDMDSTLIKTEVIDELANRAGVGDQVSAITARAMRGELDFRASFTERMGLLKGLNESVLADVAANLPMMEGCEVLIKNLTKAGIKTAILSGGFNYFASHLQEKLGFDYIFANTLQSKEGALTGIAVEPIVDAQRKAKLLCQLREDLNLSVSQTVAVGDGANDLEMLAEAGFGVAYHAKPLVRETAPHAISYSDLSALLFAFGWTEEEIQR